MSETIPIESTKVEIGYIYQTWETTPIVFYDLQKQKLDISIRQKSGDYLPKNLQKQKLDISIRQIGIQKLVLIYKSRNWIYLLDLKVGRTYEVSTKVEIGYIYQTKERQKRTNYLQKQKLDISIRQYLNELHPAIYKSRNWIYLLDIQFVRNVEKSTKVEIGYIYQTWWRWLGQIHLQKQKLDISIRPN